MRRIPAFLIAAAAVYVASILVVGEVNGLGVVAFALTADLTLVIPLLYYILLVRGRRFPVVSVAPVFLLSLLGAGLVLPEEHSVYLGWAHFLAAPVEMFVLGYIGTKAYRTAKLVRRGESDFYERLRAAARETLGANVASEIAAFEFALLYYAAAVWRKHAPEGPEYFTSHRRSGYFAVVGTLAAVMMMELIAVHIVVSQWSGTVAWVLTALSMYSFLWIVADMQAIRLRPIRLDGEGLEIRVGLRWWVRVGFEDIAGLYRVTSGLDRGAVESGAQKEKGYLKAVPMGEPRFFVTLRETVEARGIYGIRKRAKKIGFTVDEPERFETAYRSALKEWRAEQ